MRYAKMFLIGLISLALLFTLFSFFIPSTVRVSRVVEINAPAEKIYSAISDVNNWGHWMPWSGADSLFDITINRLPAVTGSSYSWQVKTDNSKTGKIVIKELTTNEVITENEMSGYKTSSGSLKLHKDPSAGFVLVEWKMRVNIKWYPWAKLKGILLDKIYGPVLENGLSRLKTHCESAKQ
jgi:uncharacterized membrane protein